ncbi:helix-turn-helix domain-containing protein [Tsukamurella paurometabola]|nr:helix-turn-helix transcriptional regulator [Tsukamurella paurometabola]
MTAHDTVHTPLADRLNSLFESTASGSGKCTNNEVARALKDLNPELRVSGAYLSALRSGARARPSVELLVALAEHFGVSVSYFTAQEPAVPLAENYQRQLNELGVRRIAMRAVGLDEDNLSTVTTVLDHVRKLQGLPPIEGDGDEDVSAGAP